MFSTPHYWGRHVATTTLLYWEFSFYNRITLDGSPKFLLLWICIILDFLSPLNFFKEILIPYTVQASNSNKVITNFFPRFTFQNISRLKHKFSSLNYLLLIYLINGQLALTDAKLYQAQKYPISQIYLLKFEHLIQRSLLYS